MKGGVNYIRGWSPPKPLKLIDPTYYWEKQILEIISEEPDDRTIHWFWSDEGNVGKTAFCKYLTHEFGAIPLHGKGADVRNGVVQFMASHNGQTPELVIFPIPRSFGSQYVSYEALENIKDMYFYSGKYEGGIVCGNSPHLIVFANSEPDYAKCSADRWSVSKILQGLPDDFDNDC